MLASLPLAFGVLRRVGSTEWDTARFGYAPLAHPEIPAGHSVEVDVAFGHQDLAEGEYEIRATAPDLALTIEGARLHVRRA